MQVGSTQATPTAAPSVIAGRPSGTTGRPNAVAATPFAVAAVSPGIAAARPAMAAVSPGMATARPGIAAVSPRMSAVSPGMAAARPVMAALDPAIQRRTGAAIDGQARSASEVSDVQPAVSLSAPQIAKIHHAAQDFEAMALGQLLAPMFNTVDAAHSAFGGGEAEATIKPLLVDAIAKHIAAHGGLGLAAPVFASMLRTQEAANAAGRGGAQ